MTWGFRWLGAFVLADLLSFLGHYEPAVRITVFGIIIVCFFVVAIYWYRVAVLAVFAELFIGSHGYLFSLDIVGLSISLRIALYIIIVSFSLPYLFKRWSNKADRGHDIRLYLPILCLGIVALIAFGRGLLAGRNFDLVFFDANGYLYWGLLLPLIAIGRDENFYRRLIQLLCLAAGYVAFKTLLLLYLFTHGSFQYFVVDLYLWLRDTRLGEFTPTTSDAYRIFMASQLFLLPAWWIGVLTPSREGKWRIATLLYSCLLSAGLLVSFSRSFWLGWCLSIIAALVWLSARQQWRRLFNVMVAVGLSAVGGFILVIIALRFPLPVPSDTARLAITERLELRGEAASSRWNLLQPLWTAVAEHIVIGSGFGRAVTYVSNDPRVRAMSASGLYTTTAFEWGYLDIWLKLGLLGLTIYGWIIVSTLLVMYRFDDWLGNSLPYVLGLVAVLGVHLGSPYLNHPLGIGLMLILYIMCVQRLQTIH